MAKNEWISVDPAQAKCATCGKPFTNGSIVLIAKDGKDKRLFHNTRELFPVGLVGQATWVSLKIVPVQEGEERVFQRFE